MEKMIRGQQHGRHRCALNYCIDTVVSNVLMWWLCYSCGLCLIANNNIDYLMVSGAYAGAEDLINDLDRPSKFIINERSSNCSIYAKFNMTYMAYYYYYYYY